MARIFQVDAFTEEPFAGNPAGVCLLDDTKPDDWMLHVAREMNLSETAFVLRADGGYGLRWFTPTTEVSLCGHATLASAHILWEEKLTLGSETITFRTKSGDLLATKSGGSIELEFPSRRVEATKNYSELNVALEAAPVFTGKYPDSKGDIYLLEFETETIIRTIVPDFKRLLATTARAVIVTSESSSANYDFVSRFFAPAVGIDEDPVTGSAHCYLMPYWGTKLRKKELVAYQASKRSRIIMCKWMEDRVRLGGKAVTIFKADLLV